MPINIYKRYKLNTAVEMRKNGASYSEIRGKIDVPKSTLTLWLRNIPLSEQQKNRLLEKRVTTAKNNAKKRIEKTQKDIEEIKLESSKSIKDISNRDLWLMGTVLYWRERMKREDSIDLRNGVSFSSGNERLLKFFTKWLVEVGRIPRSDLKYSLYVKNIFKSQKKVKSKKSQASAHTSASDLINYKIFKEALIKEWAKKLDINENEIAHVYVTTTASSSRSKHGKGDSDGNEASKGFIKIRVVKSSMLARQIAGWIEGIADRLEL